MPFCCQCGSGVKADDVFCRSCGTRQPVPAPGPAGGGRELFSKTTPRKAAILCYLPLVGWILAVIFLASARFRENAKVRFHAFQGIYVFVAWLIVDKVLDPILLFGPGSHVFAGLITLLKLAVFGAWVVMLIKTSHEEDFRLPLIGDLADKSVREQRVI